jgi:hypothetical protein
MTEEERQEEWEKLYAEPGFAKVLSVSSDIFTDHKANELYSKFHADKIRARINDPEVAEKLIPKNHGFGTRRVPLESGYFEVFNQSNVKLVDIREDPISQITETGIQTEDAFYELDVLIYATGFDAVTGSFNAVDIQGRNGTSLKDVWAEGIRTFLGLTVQDFPNMFMIMGPHQMFGNIPRYVSSLFASMSTNSYHSDPSSMQQTGLPSLYDMPVTTRLSVLKRLTRVWRSGRSMCMNAERVYWLMKLTLG